MYNLPTIHYRCSFEISEGPDFQGNIFSSIVSTIRTWIIRKELYSAEELAGAGFYNGASFRSKIKGVALETKAFGSKSVYETTDTIPEIWSMRLHHPCSDFKARRWIIDIGLNVIDNTTYRFNLELSHSIKTAFLGGIPPTPHPSAPSVVRYLLSRDYLHTKGGNEKLSVTYQAVNVGAGRDLSERILDRDRQVPLIIYSQCEERLYNYHTLTELSSLVAGAASVIELSYDSIQELNFFLPDDYRCIPGMIRVYLTNIDTTHPRDHTRHRFILPREILDRGTEETTKMLVRMVCRNLPKQEVHGAYSIHDADRIIHKLEYESLKNQYDRTEEDRKGFEKLADEIIDDQTKEISALKETIQNNESTINELENEISAKKYEVEQAYRYKDLYERKIHEANKIRESIAIFRSLPESLLDCLAAIARLFPDRLIIPESTFASANEYSAFTDINKAWEILWHIPTTLYDLLSSGVESGNLPKAFQDRTGYELAMSEGKMTKKDSKLMKLRIIQVGDETYDIIPHIIWGNKPPKMLRIHWAFDKEKDKIIIGFCGDHMTNRSSRKR